MSDDHPRFPRPFGPYTLKRKIASGGMAELFLGETTGPGGFAKPVVVKMIHTNLCEDERFVSMFTDEARIVAGFVHGNIVPIFDFGKIDGRTYLVMEFIDGVDLETLVETCRTRGIPLPPEVAVAVGIGVASALHYAHQHQNEEGRNLGIVHRDVSPHNILVSRAGEVKLCDFGIALSEMNRHGTDTGVIKGKLRYLSPEQASEEPMDHRSDLFSLGVTLYELICGHHPVVNSSAVSVLRYLSEGEGYPPIEDAAPWLSPELASVIDKSTSFSPDSRQADAEEFRRDLSNVLHSDYGDFSPGKLADLVSLVQDEAVADKSGNLDSVLRAEVASFASEVREATKTRARKVQGIGYGGGKSGLIRLVVLISMLLVGGALSLIFRPWDSAVESGHGIGADAGTPVSDGGIEVELPPEVKTVLDSGVSRDSGVGEDGPDAAPVATNGSEKHDVVKPRGVGLLVANASPWATVKIDGKSRGTTPIMDLKLPAGRHRAVFSNPDTGARVKRSFVIRPGKTTKLIVEMP